jgi:hypothetical protein
MLTRRGKEEQGLADLTPVFSSTSAFKSNHACLIGLVFANMRYTRVDPHVACVAWTTLKIFR